MKQEPHWMKELEGVLLKIAAKPSSLLWIDELKAFYLKFKGRDEFNRVKFECDSLISMIYHHAGFIEKSFDIDIRLLDENGANVTGYWEVISRAVGTSDLLNRSSEIIPFAFNFLTTPNDDISRKRIVMSWYANVFSEKDDSFFYSFEHLIIAMESFLEEKTCREVPFVERLHRLNEKYTNALVASNTFAMAYSKAKLEDREQLLKEYLETKPPKYYKELIKTYK